MKLWTYKHFISYIPALLLMAVIAIVLRKFLLDKPIEIRFIPFRISALVLLAIEIIKQIVSIERGYDLYHLPFHFCSMFIFFIPLFAFYRGKWSSHIKSFTTFICTTLFLFMLVCPNYAYSADKIEGMFGDFLFFHTVAFHNIVVFEFILIIALNLYEPSVKFDLKNALVFLSSYCLIGGITAQLFKTNYNNFYYCAVEFADNIRLAIIDAVGHTLGQAIYVLGVSAVSFAFSFASYFVLISIYTTIKNRHRTH